MMMTNEVRLPDVDPQLRPTYRALDWLVDERKLKPHKDWTINMHGGNLGYTSFFFADHRLAIEFKMRFI